MLLGRLSTEEALKQSQAIPSSILARCSEEAGHHAVANKISVLVPLFQANFFHLSPGRFCTFGSTVKATASTSGRTVAQCCRRSTRVTGECWSLQTTSTKECLGLLVLVHVKRRGPRPSPDEPSEEQGLFTCTSRVVLFGACTRDMGVTTRRNTSENHNKKRRNHNKKCRKQDSKLRNQNGKLKSTPLKPLTLQNRYARAFCAHDQILT